MLARWFNGASHPVNRHRSMSITIPRSKAATDRLTSNGGKSQKTGKVIWNGIIAQLLRGCSHRLQS